MAASSPIDPFQPYLFSGERILWTGRPKTGFVLRPADAFLIPFSLLWTGMVVWMFIETFNMPGGGQLDIVLILFLLLGLYFTIGRFIHDALVRNRLNYAVTDQRILVLRSPNASNIVSLDVRHLPKLELTQYRDGTGTIAFETQNWFPAGVERTRSACGCRRSMQGRSYSASATRGKPTS